MDSVIFDYDGTIHNSMLTYAPAFRDTLKWLSDGGYISGREYSDEEISYWLGFNSTDMWSRFQPELDPAVREEARIRLGEDMAERIEKNGEGALYEGAGDMLLSLKAEGHTLIFLSNCRFHYMERHKRVFGLERFFDFFYCCEAFGFIPKYEIFRRIAPEHRAPFIVVGDRFHDIETSVQNGLPSIGCGYGYGSPGELDKADIIVNSVSGIPGAGHNILSRKEPK